MILRGVVIGRYSIPNQNESVLVKHYSTLDSGRFCELFGHKLFDVPMNARAHVDIRCRIIFKPGIPAQAVGDRNGSVPISVGC